MGAAEPPFPLPEPTPEFLLVCTLYQSNSDPHACHSCFVSSLRLSPIVLHSAQLLYTFGLRGHRKGFGQYPTGTDADIPHRSSTKLLLVWHGDNRCDHV